MLGRNPLGPLVILFIAILTVIVASPFLQIDGIPVGTGDIRIHLHRSAAVERAFRQGVFWPRWFPELYNDLGAPDFHHYSPGLYWLVAAAHRIGVRLDNALKLVMTVALTLSGFGVYGWLRQTFSPTACLAAASIYVLHPVILTRTVYYAGDYPQALALLLLPVCLGACTALYNRASSRTWLAAIIAMASLAVSHNLMALVGGIVLLSWWIMMFVGHRNVEGSLRCGGAALLAMLVTAAFWLPSVFDLPYVQFDNTQEKIAHFSEFFLGWWQLTGFQSPILDNRAGNPLMPIDTFGVASWLALLAGLAAAVIGPSREHRVWGAAGSLFAILMLAMASSLSEPLWESLSGLSLFQYPSRFLLVAPLGASVAAAATTDVLGKNYRWLSGLALVLASLLVVFPYLFPKHTPMFSAFMPVKSLSPDDTRSFGPKLDAWGLTSFDEFLVQDADMRVIRGEIEEPKATRLNWRSPHEGTVDLSKYKEPALLRLHFHPGWSAGAQASLSSGSAGWTQVTGLLNPSQPLVIRWRGTDWQHRGELLSLLGITGIVAVLILQRFRKRDAKIAVPPMQTGSIRGVAPLAVCVLAAAVARFAVDASSGGPFLRQSPSEQLAFATEGEPVTLGRTGSETVTLLGWELLDGERPKPGEAVSIRLYWQAHSKFEEDFHTILHLYAPQQRRSWAVENQAIPRPPTRVWNPELYYIETIRLYIPLDIPPAPFTLATGLVSASAERLSVPGSTDGLLFLRETTVEPLRAGLFQKVHATTKTPADTDDGLHLQGYDLEDGPAGRSLRLFWETGDGVAGDWITYIHMTDQQGDLVAQFDGPPFAGLLPTSQWKPNSLYIDSRELELPSGLAPGDYLLRIGLYSFESGERLPFIPDDSGQRDFESGQLVAQIKVHAADSCYICRGDQ